MLFRSIAGMFFGVPVFACLHCMINFFVDMRLRKKGLPQEFGEYAAGGSHGPGATGNPLEKTKGKGPKNL